MREWWLGWLALLFPAVGVGLQCIGLDMACPPARHLGNEQMPEMKLSSSGRLHGLSLGVRRPPPPLSVSVWL